MTAESGYWRQLGTFAFEKLAGADRNPDFVAILAQEATVDLDAADGQQTPRYLTNFPNLLEGVKKLHLKADLQPGAYRVTYGFLDCGMPSTVHSIDWTGGYELPARWVIHTVGPVWSGGEQGEDGLLASCYRNSLTLAEQRGVRTIAFPAISTGVYRFPLERATRIAITETLRHLEGGSSVQKVVFVCFSDRAYEAYTAALKDLAGG